MFQLAVFRELRIALQEAVTEALGGAIGGILGSLGGGVHGVPASNTGFNVIDVDADADCVWRCDAGRFA